jgi:hypothetical protein
LWHRFKPKKLLLAQASACAFKSSAIILNQTVKAPKCYENKNYSKNVSLIFLVLLMAQADACASKQFYNSLTFGNAKRLNI